MQHGITAVGATFDYSGSGSALRFVAPMDLLSPELGCNFTHVANGTLYILFGVDSYPLRI